jgi:anti-sigma regulatory factor (Ser/Thr protein kinase)
VPLLDVLRSAIAEVEDFARVDVRGVPAARVVGGAVADLTHLVAELVENATVFSPPDARVTVRATPVDGRCVVEVEDAGLGMGPQALAEANARLADARASDMFDSDRLGLFVVSRLARRHGVQVLLSASAGGGTLACVWLPIAVLEQGGLEPGGLETAARPPEELEAADPFDRRRQPDAAPRTPEPAAPADGWGHEARAKRQPAPSAAVTVGENGLPRRVRQSSLAPQLRGHRTATRVSGSDERLGADPRSPEEVRATMAAFQNGWTLGRASADDTPNDRRGSG